MAAWTALAAMTAPAASPQFTPGPGSHYATDAFPSFDDEKGILERVKKEPGFFAWFSSPAEDNPAAQLALARSLVAGDSLRAARKAYDALVTYWPLSPEAPVAQRELADLYAEQLDMPEEAYREYKYLTDFYAAECEYDTVVRRMYDMACEMRERGKNILFINFSNSTDARRAFEGVVSRAPGAVYAPDALRAVAELRAQDGSGDAAVAAYECLRNLYPGSAAASAALSGEVRQRMQLLEAHGYNRARCLDSLNFFKLAQSEAKDEALREEIAAAIKRTSAVIEAEALAAARFYDTPRRAKAAAIGAYQMFLREYPTSELAPIARARIAELKGAVQ